MKLMVIQESQALITKASTMAAHIITQPSTNVYINVDVSIHTNAKSTMNVGNNASNLGNLTHEDFKHLESKVAQLESRFMVHPV